MDNIVVIHVHNLYLYYKIETYAVNIYFSFINRKIKQKNKSFKITASKKKKNSYLLTAQRMRNTIAILYRKIILEFRHETYIPTI